MIGPIVLASDASYAMPLATALRSLAEANQRHWPIDVRVLVTAFPEAMRLKVERSLPRGAVAIEWLPIEVAQFGGFGVQNHISRMTYARLLIPSLLPQTAVKVLYLDADILVLGDLGALWATDVGNVLTAAVVDGLDQQVRDGMAGTERVPRVQRYFNAGVLLINLEGWRRERVAERALEYLARNPSTPYSDQDALNVVCDGRWLPLDRGWNFVDFSERTEIASLAQERRPGVIHFATALKPWNYRFYSCNARLYDTFRQRTQFARTPGNMMVDYVKTAIRLMREGPATASSR